MQFEIAGLEPLPDAVKHVFRLASWPPDEGSAQALWVTRHLPGVRFARYADDAVLQVGGELRLEPLDRLRVDPCGSLIGLRLRPALLLPARRLGVRRPFNEAGPHPTRSRSSGWSSNRMCRLGGHWKSSAFPDRLSTAGMIGIKAGDRKPSRIAPHGRIGSGTASQRQFDQRRLRWFATRSGERRANSEEVRGIAAEGSRSSTQEPETGSRRLYAGRQSGPSAGIVQTDPGTT